MEEIVKCKDCKYAHLTYAGECKYCDMWDSDDALYLPADFFCAFAEKKGDNYDQHRSDQGNERI